MQFQFSFSYDVTGSGLNIQLLKGGETLTKTRRISINTLSIWLPFVVRHKV